MLDQKTDNTLRASHLNRALKLVCRDRPIPSKITWIMQETINYFVLNPNKHTETKLSKSVGIICRGQTNLNRGKKTNYLNFLKTDRGHLSIT